MTGEIWALAEQDQGVLSEAAQEVLTEGKKLASKLRAKICAVLLGHQVGHLVEHLAGSGAATVYLAEHPILHAYSPDAYASVLASAVRKHRPQMVLMGNTPLGRDLAATLAGRLRVGLVSGCTFINVDSSNQVHMIRPVFAGKASASYAYLSPRPWLATLRTGFTLVDQPTIGRAAETIGIDVDEPEVRSRTRSLGVTKGGLAQMDLADADIVVAGGRGAGRPEGFRLIEELAGVLGGKVGGTRYAVDAGWIPRDQQIGVSGKAVAPMLYIACGISGAVHHVEGIRESRAIMAINEDRAAPIFKIADLGIVGDLHEVVPAIIARLKKGLSAPVSR